jgi:hypothetical protein
MRSACSSGNTSTAAAQQVMTNTVLSKLMHPVHISVC